MLGVIVLISASLAAELDLYGARVCTLMVVVFLENGEDGPNGVRVEGGGGVYSHRDSVSR